jgi:hypothetical protein
MKKHLWLLPLALMLAACGGLGTGASATPPTVATATPATVQPAATTPAPTATATPGVLPAPLYYLNSADSQIWRIERDGVTKTQITRESTPVTGFDVSRADGALAYVVDNDLVRADANGQSRTVLAEAEPFDPNAEGGINRALTNPLWSPDGAWIAYGLNGVNMIPAAGGAPSILKQSSPYPDLNTNPSRESLTSTRFYRPIAWSPDGSRVLAWAAMFMEGSEYVVIPVDGSPLVTLQGQSCCQAVWSADGASIYVAQDSLGMFQPGLWRVGASTGEATPLVAAPEGEIPAELALIGFVWQAGDGQLYNFRGVQPTNVDTVGMPQLLIMTRSAADGVTGAVPLRADGHIIREALWAEDASGAVIVDATTQPAGQYSPAGPLLWLRADGRPAIDLTAQGSVLRWGK